MDYGLEDQLRDARINREVRSLARQVERETVDLAAGICAAVAAEIGALPGSSIHSALLEAESRIRKLTK